MMTWWFTNTSIDYFKDGLCLVFHVHVYVATVLVSSVNERPVCNCTFANFWNGAGRAVDSVLERL